MGMDSLILAVKKKEEDDDIDAVLLVDKIKFWKKGNHENVRILCLG